MSSPRTLGRVLFPLLAVVGLALTLRVPISSLAVVLPDARGPLELSGLEVSLLTTLPVLCFAAFGLWLGPRVARVGLHRAGAAVLLVMAAGVGMRAVTASGWVFIVATVLILAAIAVGNVLLPAVAKAHFPRHIALVSSLFGAAVIGGSTLGALEGGWISDTWGWRAALGAAAVLIVVVGLAWLPLLRQDRSTEMKTQRIPARRVARLREVWPLVACFGLVSAQAYAQLGWYPAILAHAGLTTLQAATAFAVLTGAGIPTILTLPGLTGLVGDRGAIVIFAVATAAGWCGILWSPTSLTWVWSALIGFGAGSFAWTLTMIGRHTQTPSGTAALSSFVQGAGYLVAAVGPFGVGLLHDATASWTAPLWLLVVTGLGIGVFGVLASGPWALEALIDDPGGSSSEQNQAVGPVRQAG